MLALWDFFWGEGTENTGLLARLVAPVTITAVSPDVGFGLAPFGAGAYGGSGGTTSTTTVEATQITEDTECGVVVTHLDGTSHYFPGYFSGVAAEPAPMVQGGITNPATISQSGSASAIQPAPMSAPVVTAGFIPFDSGGVGSLSLIPFDPTNPATPRSLSFPLQHGDRYQNTGAVPQFGVYTPTLILNSVPSAVSDQVP